MDMTLHRIISKRPIVYLVDDVYDIYSEQRKELG